MRSRNFRHRSVSLLAEFPSRERVIGISNAHARGVDVGFSIDRTIKFGSKRRCDVYPG
jgi:hypothetical protein